jgi:hypothetical protein
MNAFRPVAPENGQAGRNLPVVRVHAGTRAEVSFQTAHFWTFATHWFGRQLVCPGADCPACGTYAERVGTYFLVQVCEGPRWRPAILELGQGSWARLRMLVESEGWEVGPGLTAECCRRGAKSSLRIEPTGMAGVVQKAYDDPLLLFDALVCLFRWAPRRRDEGVAAYCDRSRPRLIADLEAAIGCRG